MAGRKAWTAGRNPGAAIAPLSSVVVGGSGLVRLECEAVVDATVEFEVDVEDCDGGTLGSRIMA